MTEDLSGWKYEIESLQEKYPDFKPIKVVDSIDTSESYEMDRSTIFKDKTGKYWLLYESGCSCYDMSDDAELTVYPSLSALTASLKKEEYGSRQALWKKMIGVKTE